MPNNEKTSLFKIKDMDTEIVRATIKEIYSILEERGYNPSNQIVGYLISGDLGYISSYKNARNKIQKLDRAKIVEILLQEFQKHDQ